MCMGRIDSLERERQTLNIEIANLTHRLRIAEDRVRMLEGLEGGGQAALGSRITVDRMRSLEEESTALKYHTSQLQVSSIFVPSEFE